MNKIPFGKMPIWQDAWNHLVMSLITSCVNAADVYRIFCSWKVGLYTMVQDIIGKVCIDNSIVHDTEVCVLLST